MEKNKIGFTVLKHKVSLPDFFFKKKITLKFSVNVVLAFRDLLVGHFLANDKANASDTEAAFLDLHLSISNGIVSTKIYDKRDDLILKLSISHF